MRAIDRKRYNNTMRYLVRAKLKPGRQWALLKAIEQGDLGAGSVAEGEYLRNMGDARLCPDETTRWVEVCYCPRPLLEERPYWEEYFELARVQDAHDRRRCRDWNGEEAWACGNCDCTERLERKLESMGKPFLDELRNAATQPEEVKLHPARTDPAARKKPRPEITPAIQFSSD